MLVDVFPLHDELDMLEFRLRVLDPVVDRFVIVEADRTFSGNKKPFYYGDNAGRFAWAKDKIIHHPVTVNPNIVRPGVPPPAAFDPAHQCWKIEHAQRNAMLSPLKDFPGDTQILFGDVDEIPRRDAVHYLKNAVDTDSGPIVFLMHMFSYNLRFLRNLLWHGTIFTDMNTLRETGCQSMRDMKDHMATGINNCGWHLSWFGGAERIVHKLESFSHQEYNKDEYKDPLRIAHCIETGEALLPDANGKPIHVAPQAFPDYFRESAPIEWWGA